MKKIWWTWDVRMRWAYGFCYDKESYLKNYKNAIDAAIKYGVNAIVIWGFLRDSHGGIDSAMEICEYADKKGIDIYPGVGIDAYGGVYHEGNHRYSLNTYLEKHPKAYAIKKDGSHFEMHWPKTSKSKWMVACSSFEGLMPYYEESIEWLIKTFNLKGFQIEQGDVGLCYCTKCRKKPRVSPFKKDSGYKVLNETISYTDMAERLGPLLKEVLSKRPELTIILESYAGLLSRDIARAKPFLSKLPKQICYSWQAYDGIGRFYIDDKCKNPFPNGCMAIRTNNDFYDGEIDETKNIRKAIALAKNAGIETSYMYGEYPDSWPITQKNYAIWAKYSK